MKITVAGLGEFSIDKDGNVTDFQEYGTVPGYSPQPFQAFLLSLIIRADESDEDLISELVRQFKEKGITTEVLSRFFDLDSMSEKEKEKFLFTMSGGFARWQYGREFRDVEADVWESVEWVLWGKGYSGKEIEEKLDKVFIEAVQETIPKFSDVKALIESTAREELKRIKSEKDIENYLYGLLEAVEAVNDAVDEEYKERLIMKLNEKIPELDDDSSPEP